MKLPLMGMRRKMGSDRLLDEVLYAGKMCQSLVRYAVPPF